MIISAPLAIMFHQLKSYQIIWVRFQLLSVWECLCNSLPYVILQILQQNRRRKTFSFFSYKKFLYISTSSYCSFNNLLSFYKDVCVSMSISPLPRDSQCTDDHIRPFAAWAVTYWNQPNEATGRMWLRMEKTKLEKMKQICENKSDNSWLLISSYSFWKHNDVDTHTCRWPQKSMTLSCTILRSGVKRAISPTYLFKPRTRICKDLSQSKQKSYE
jgi:hypothetical protein